MIHRRILLLAIATQAPTLDVAPRVEDEEAVKSKPHTKVSWESPFSKSNVAE